MNLPPLGECTPYIVCGHTKHVSKEGETLGTRRVLRTILAVEEPSEEENR